MVGKIALFVILSAFVTTCVVGAQSTDFSQDEGAIRKTIESYVDAYNRGDASAAASHWSREGSYLNRTGDYVQGPDKILTALKELFNEDKGVTVQVAVFDVQNESPDRATVKGFAVFARPGQENDELLFNASLVKEGGAWKILKVEDEKTSVPLSTIAKLGELEWLIGDWIDQDENANITTTFRWTKDYAFISGTFRVTIEDRVDLEGTQVIGWDPSAKKFRSWIFDTKAGFAEGEWTKDGDTWTVNLKSTLGTGGKASSMNIYKYVDSNSFTWRSISREVDGELLPDIDEVTVVRKNADKAQAEVQN